MFNLERIIEITRGMGIEIVENSNVKHKMWDFNGERIEINTENLRKYFCVECVEQSDEHDFEYKYNYKLLEFKNYNGYNFVSINHSNNQVIDISFEYPIGA